MWGSTMKNRNIFGRLEYKKGAFFVEKKPDINAKYKILRYDSNAVMVTDAVMMPLFDVPVFDSFVRAARFLRDNYADLI